MLMPGTALFNVAIAWVRAQLSCVWQLKQLRFC